MESAAVIGVGITRYGRITDRSFAEIAFEAAWEAMRDAGVDREGVDLLVVGNVGGWSSEPLPAVTISEYLGLDGNGSMRVEAACASGSAAIKVAADAVTSGQSEVAMVIGVERMNESPVTNVVELIGRAGNYFWEFENFGLTFPAYYALYANSYMQIYGAKEEDLAEVAVKNHYYGSLNPKAYFRQRVTVDDVMKSRYVAWPLKLLDCSPITDGAAALIVTSEGKAREFTDTPVYIRSIGTGTGTSNISRRDDLLGFDAVRKAAREAYRRAGIDPSRPHRQIDLALVHDCFTIAEVMAYEDLGFVRRGEGYMLVKEHQTYIGGIVPVNTDGGLKAKGHPIGATGVGMAVEVVKQLRRAADPQRQVDVRNGVALTHNVGGTGHYAYVAIYSI
ncbi:MAG: thiolase domain-containing protein [Aigarchaeota archaeon]|nr:thiolase domain-containing protein [Aigarchaeota archaeon]MDW8092130.1 thiolase domain-containing protein [Nitrososphaerota archaeon]